MVWPEPANRNKIDGGELGAGDVHALSGVQHFALCGFIDDHMPMVGAAFNNQPHSLPLGFVALTRGHSIRQYAKSHAKEVKSERRV